METSRKKLISRETIQRYGAVVMFIALYVFNAFYTKGFFTWRIFWNLIIQASPAILVAFGMTLVIATGNINISVGSMMGLGGVIFAYFVKRGGSPMLWLVVSLALGAAVGALLGVIVSKFKVQSMIATMSGMYILRGVARVIANGSQISYNNAAVSALSERLASQYPSTKAFNIPVLPEVYRPSLAEKYAGANGNVIPAAVDITTVEPYMYNTQRAVIYVISKTERKPIFIQGLAELLSKNADVIVCDEANKFISLAETGYRRFTDRKQFVSAVSEISVDTQTRTYIFINGMGSFMNSVIMPERKIIETLMAAAVKNAMITFVISDKMTETGSYSSEAWFKEVQNGSYIWLGSGLFDQYQFQLSNRGKNVELGEDYGYIVEDGRAECVKLLSSEVYEIEK